MIADFIMEFLVMPVIALVCVGMLVGLVVYWPVELYADMKCKQRGYPRADVTISLESYCMTLDGAVTVKLEKL